MTIWLIITLVSLFFSALFSGVEMAYVTSDRVRVQLDVQRGGFISGIINRFYTNSELFISTILVGNNIMLVVYGMGFAKLIEPRIAEYISNEAGQLALTTLLSTLVILLNGEFLPKTIFGINPNNTLKLMAMPMGLFWVILYPVSRFTAWLSRMIMRMVGVKDKGKGLGILSIGELNDYLEETIDDVEETRGTVENEVKIFQNALDFSSTHLRDCMIPRNELVAVNIETTTREELSKLFQDSGRSKILVFRDDIDSIVGYIHVSELFTPEKDWHEQIKPVLYAPENLLANVMMRRLLQQKRSVAIVIDEFGGTAGMLTLEDLVEEIFGNIEDEHDNSGLIQREVAPGIYEFSGRCEIAQINEAFNLDFPEDDSYQTIAGYILHETGTIPEQGQTVMLGEERFDILEKTANRIELIRYSRPSGDGSESESKA